MLFEQVTLLIMPSSFGHLGERLGEMPFGVVAKLIEMCGQLCEYLAARLSGTASVLRCSVTVSRCTGTLHLFAAFCVRGAQPRRTLMPIIILWAVPAVIVIGGGIYWLGHLH